ncbi:DUF4870 domain-containing protein [Dactylosporangium roseum]|uniref:DUF4870 domain-containing protein n=1 Tax=Dactylosporangium roseum TaxID=47989 RepID=A0ABY5ZE94_9ACTN|nr:DUF4870 domain-containing protein [Dactylosporangium roseum]UWZ38988.1 DUF4870 domain-containing protein [Dactylosporangium roseum]
MTEPPRPPGEYGSPSDPYSTPPSYPGGTPGAGYPPPTSGAGYQQQGYGAYQQPGAYGTPGGAPVGYANSDEKTWALIAHFGGILVGFIAPLVALLAKGNESPTVKAHANEALNFHITWGIAMIISVVIAVCTFGIASPLPLLVWVFVLAFAIIAGMKANNGELYRYPATFRFIK